jgi:hypothetical protein
MTSKEIGIAWFCIGGGALMGRLLFAPDPAWATCVAGGGAMAWGFFKLWRAAQ